MVGRVSCEMQHLARQFPEFELPAMCEIDIEGIVERGAIYSVDGCKGLLYLFDALADTDGNLLLLQVLRRRQVVFMGMCFAKIWASALMAYPREAQGLTESQRLAICYVPQMT